MTNNQAKSMSARGDTISGFVKPGFEAVQDTFVENFKRRNELGAACCIYHRGEKVVDRRGGVRIESAHQGIVRFSHGACSFPRAVRLRRAHIDGGPSEIFTVPFPSFLTGMNPRSTLRRVLAGSLFTPDKKRVYARNFEVPSRGGVGTARAIAHAYSVFATGKKEFGLGEETLRQLEAPAVAPLNGFRDGALKAEIPFSLGFSKPHPRHPSGSPGSFGAPGTGDSLGFADPEATIGYGYVLNGMGWHLEDPRELALRTAMYRSIGKSGR